MDFPDELEAAVSAYKVANERTLAASDAAIKARDELIAAVQAALGMILRVE